MPAGFHGIVGTGKRLTSDRILRGEVKQEKAVSVPLLLVQKTEAVPRIGWRVCV